MEFTNLLLTVTCAALGVLIGFLAWWGNGVTKKLDALILHREGCISRFADKENNSNDHRRMWNVLDEQKTTVHGHGIRLDALEQQLKCRERTGSGCIGVKDETGATDGLHPCGADGRF